MATGKRGEKALQLGARLKYPIRITKLYKRPGDMIKRQEPVLQYSFEYTMELPQDRSTLELQTKTLTSITDWNAPENGKLLKWNVRVGDVVFSDRTCVTVEEACTHEIQFQGLCALCGKDMNEVNWASEQRDTDRAPINMTHDQTSLTVSRVAATRAESELQRRLLGQRKLSLVVDLDQTIIHACIDPTIGEWQNDPTNPNYEALRDVQAFQLEEGQSQGGVARGCFYYIKMRPGLKEFLTKIATMFELHVYTMGTRTYATSIAKIVDPDQRLFGNRVISRDENGNMVAKSLQRIFPVSTHMAVIIDDRADVWPYNRHNLIKVSPYDFFKGTGDINGSFLPKRSDIPAAATPSTSTLSTTAAAAAAEATSTAAPTETTTPTSTTPTDALPSVTSDDKLAAASPASSEASSAISTTTAKTEKTTSTASTNGSGSKVPGAGESVDVVLLQKQTEEQERAIEKQIKDRPLQHMQEQLDKEDKDSTVESSSAERHCVLYDDDTELQYLQEHLTKLHAEFFKAYETKKSRDRRSKDDMAIVPDAGEILDDLKAEVLAGTTIVLSGLVPNGIDVARSEIGIQALSFGSDLQTRVSKRTTHLVVSSDRPRTEKVRQAARISTIKIVNQNWLIDCFSQWKKLDEAPYLVEVHQSDRNRSSKNTSADATDTDVVSDADSDAGLPINNPSNGEDGEFKEFEDDDPTSPLAELKTFDWGAADDELADFLADDDDDDDDDDEDEGTTDGETDNNDEDVDMAGANGISGGLTSKRKFTGSSQSTNGNDTDTDNDSDRSVSSRNGRGRARMRGIVAKRQKLVVSSRSRSSSRVPASAASAAEGGHPLRSVASTEDAVKNGDDEDNAEIDVDDEELMAEFMAAGEESEEA